jgi:tetratricopeptide (TPR) repeat protein
MEMRRIAVFIAVAGLVWGTPAVARAAKAPAGKPSCAAGDALLGAGDADAAREAYVALLKQADFPPCAVSGLKLALGGAPPPPDAVTCGKADQAFDAGNLVLARSRYVLLGRDVKCAASGLAAVTQVLRICAQGQVDLANHHKDDARAAFQSALAKNPNAGCASKGLTRASAPAAARMLDTSVSVLSYVALFIGLLLGLAFLLLLLGHFPRVWRGLVRVWPIRGLIGPRLSLDPLGDSAAGDTLRIGDAMSARIRERLQRYQTEALDPSHAVDDDIFRADPSDRFAQVVSASSTLQSALGEVRDVSEHGAFVAALLNLLYALLPVRRLSVSGVLDPVAAGGGATLSFQVGSRLSAATTLMPRPAPGDNDPAVKYMTLVEPGAVWVQYEVARNIAGDRARPGEAQSYVLLRSGLDAQASDPAAAKTRYEEAIALNKTNWAAWVNLSTVTAELADGPGEPGQIADAALTLMTA